MESQEAVVPQQPGQVMAGGRFPYRGRRWYPPRRKQPAAPAEQPQEEAPRQVDPSQYYEILQKLLLSEDFERQWEMLLDCH